MAVVDVGVTLVWLVLMVGHSVVVGFDYGVIRLLLVLII